MKIIITMIFLVSGTVFIIKDKIPNAARPNKTEEIKKQYDKLYNVKRGNFYVSLNINGSLQPLKEYEIKPEAKSQFALEIIEIVKNNRVVKTGDILCRFSDEYYLELLDSYKLSMESEQKNLKVAYEELNAQEFNNIASIKNAAVAHRLSQEELDRYIDEDSLRLKKNYLKKIEENDRSVENAEKYLDGSKKRLADNQEQNLVKTLELDLKLKEKALESAEDLREKALYDLKIFKRYTYNTTVLKLQESVTRNKLALQNIIIKARSDLVKQRQGIDLINKRMDKIKIDIEKVEEILKYMVIKAPVDGIFSKAPSKDQYGRDTGEWVAGTKVYYGQKIGSIPDMSKFLVNLSIPESYRSYVKKGLKAEIKIKPLPDVKLTGIIDNISTIAVHDLSWDNNSPKRYPTKILTDQTDPRLTPGMTVSADIIIDSVKNALYVPIEAVYNREGKTYLRLEQGDKIVEREVTCNRSSVDFVEITAGLKDGDKVILNWVEED